MPDLSTIAPPVLKPALPYLKHAEQLDNAPGQQSPMMAYFCRAYAMDVGIKVCTCALTALGVPRFLFHPMLLLFYPARLALGPLFDVRASENGQCMCANLAFLATHPCPPSLAAALAHIAAPQG
jgi:hypothetical protein